MFKNMSIKMKLISSFSVIAVLIAVLAFYSIYAVGKSADGFSSYREMARDSVLAGRIQANMLMVRMNVKDYLATKSQQDIDEFNDYFNKTMGFTDEAQRQIKDPSRAPLIIKIDQELEKYKNNFIKVTEFMKQRDDIKNNSLDVNGKKIEQLLSSIMYSAKEDKDFIASLESCGAIRNVMLARLYTAKFLDSNSQKDFDRVNKEFDDLKKELLILKKEIQNPKRKGQLSQAVELINQYEKGVASIHNIIVERNKAIHELNIAGPLIAKLSEDIKLSIKKEQDKIGPEVASLNESINMTITIISIIILVMAVTLSIVIPRNLAGLIDTFQKGLLGFFKYLNKETASVNLIDIDTNDEIGVMTKVVNSNIEKTRSLIEQDTALLDDVKRVVTEVGHGRLNQRIEKSTQSENLTELKEIFNNMLDIMSKDVCEDINKLNRVLENFAKLDFTDRVENDEGGVAKGLNNLAEIINEMLRENKSNGLTLDHSSDVLLKNVDILNQNSNEAAAALEETAAALEEITSNISNNTNNIIQMSNLANSVTQSASTGERLANETTTAMTEIDKEVNAINEAITVIDQIAFQTNILSLNAAVEAATAGEAGKGFAVVAQEVRNLASRSAEAANEIKTLVQNATTKANDGKSIADQMINGYSELNDNISKTIELIKDVEMASKEQQQGIEQINDAVNSLDQQTQQNAMIASQTHDVALETDEIAKLVVSDANSKNFIGKDNVQKKDSNKGQNRQEQKHAPTPPAAREPKTHTADKKPVSQKLETVTSNSDDDEWSSF